MAASQSCRVVRRGARVVEMGPEANIVEAGDVVEWPMKRWLSAVKKQLGQVLRKVCLMREDECRGS
jgi:hypothetical protein